MNNKAEYFDIISKVEKSKEYSIEAIDLVKENNFKRAEKLIEKASKELKICNEMKSNLVKSDLKEKGTEISIGLINFNDQLMSSMLIRDLAKEFIEVYRISHIKGYAYNY